MMKQPLTAALQKILEAQKNQQQTLDLSDLGLSRLPKELFQLKHLCKLYLQNNKINTISPDIDRLTNLQELNLSHNHLHSLPKTLGKLKSLKRLFLQHNNIANLPKPIRHLSSLQQLDLSYNKMSGLPSYISHLSCLEHLILHHNQISKFPQSIDFERLQVLNLAHNKLTNLPASIAHISRLQKIYMANNQIAFLPENIGQLKRLHVLDLRNNNLNKLPQSVKELDRLQSNQTELNENKGLNLIGNRFNVPAEILSREPADIIQYIFDLQTSEDAQPLHEAKLIFIGSGYVGKTSLIKQILEGSFNQFEAKTDGIDITEWSIRRGKEQIKLNIWDFGGQEIMHATHKFFMTSRTSYILVINPRSEDKYGDSELEYWLKLIRSYAGEVPIVVAINKCDVHRIDLPKGEIRDKYPNIVGFVETSCKKNVGIGQLKKLIRKSISKLTHIDDLVPKTYFEIKHLLEERNEDYIPYDRYQQICKEVAPSFESESMRTLVRLLHDLGVMLNFDDDRRLRDTQVLNPEWVTKGVYQIISSPRLIKKKGILTVREIKNILNAEKYPSEKERSYIMDMMDRFELCYQMPDVRDTYFVPGAFPKDRPKKIVWLYQPHEIIRFQYHYDVMPGSIMSRFIVKMHNFIRGRDYWRNGLVIKRNNCHAFVRADPEDCKIFIAVAGKGRRRETLAFVRGQFELIHERLPKIKVESKIPVDMKGEVVLDYEDLLFHEEMGEETILVRALRERIPIKQLLNGIESEKARENRRRKEAANQANMSKNNAEKQIPSFATSFQPTYDEEITSNSDKSKKPFHINPIVAFLLSLLAVLMSIIGGCSEFLNLLFK